jgi:glutamate--cysteine ligase
MTQPYPPYEALGIFNPGGEYNQLATTLLQIENEFYGVIRPKRVIRSGERPLHALRERGVEYVEVRCMDLDPFEPLGIGAGTIAFLDVFLLHCLLADSPPDTPDEIAALARNQHRTAERGRDPDLRLERKGSESTIAEWGAQLLDECAPIAAALDGAHGGRAHMEAIALAAAALYGPQQLPSARVLQALHSQHDGSYNGFVKACAERTRTAVMRRPFPDEARAEFIRLAADSIDEQRRVELADTVPFEEFRQQYLSPQRLEV